MAIRELRNLGRVAERMLAKAGIDSEKRLRELGSVRAYLAVKQAGNRPGLSFLWALEGALSDRHWDEVARYDRLTLLKELENAESGVPGK